FILEKHSETEEIRKKICDYLSLHMYNDGGWGYNRRVATDIDSTTQALLVLQRMFYPFPSFLVDNILSAQTAEGGFPTYKKTNLRPNLWQDPHVDITFIVIELLKRIGGYEREIEKANVWLRKQQNEAGMFTCFWWDGDAYSIWAQYKTAYGSLLTPEKILQHMQDAKMLPDIAMLLPAAITFDLAHHHIMSYYNILANTQLQDGSWKCSPCLKVPHRYIKNAACKIYRDDTRLLSTAHGLHASLCMLQYLKKQHNAL
ncbi:MAG: hypothetical protein H7X71_06215, partial [Chitinophagales bacterium]|nr:hypothetical protein [Chitinophagales bacterium]